VTDVVDLIVLNPQVDEFVPNFGQKSIRAPDFEEPSPYEIELGDQNNSDRGSASPSCEEVAPLHRVKIRGLGTRWSHWLGIGAIEDVPNVRG
jgi:hypothetical protein